MGLVTGLAWADADDGIRVGGSWSSRGNELEEVGIAATALGDSCGVVRWLWIVAGRFMEAVDCTPLRLYLDVGTKERLVLLDMIDDRAEMGAVGGCISSFVTSTPGRV